MASTTSTRPQLSYLSDELNQLKQKGTHFRLRVLDDEQAPVCHFDGRKVINLASNNYLGLTTHPKLREAALEATRKYAIPLLEYFDREHVTRRVGNERIIQ